MPRVEEWERDLLGNLAGSVDILPDERVQMNALSSWLIQKPREWLSHYETRVANEWPRWRVRAREVEDSILRRAGIGRKGSNRIVGVQEKENRADAGNGGGKGCAAGDFCRAPREASLEDSTHHCLECRGRVHCALWCGENWGEYTCNAGKITPAQLSADGKRSVETIDHESLMICRVCIDRLEEQTCSPADSDPTVSSEELPVATSTSSDPSQLGRNAYPRTLRIADQLQQSPPGISGHFPR